MSNDLGAPFRVNFEITQTVDNENKQHLKIDARKAVELYATYSSTYKADVEILLESLQNNNNFQLSRTRYACGMGKCNCFISYDGKVSPCIETRAMGINIFDKRFDEIWDSIGKITYEELKDTNVKNYKCLTCKNVSICKSCPAIRENKYGSPIIVKNEDCEFAFELSKYILESTKLDIIK